MRFVLMSLAVSSFMSFTPILWAEPEEVGLSSEQEEVILPVSQIYNQSGTQWCWAYSAFHTLRTYYANQTSDDASVKAWREALSPLDSSSAFRSFMGSHFSTQRTGDPDEFVNLLEREKNLPESAWTNYYPSDIQSQREAAALAQGRLQTGPTKHMARRAILQQVEANLRRGVPAVFCNPEHCMLLYGAVFANGKAAKYAIGDSVGGRTYQVDASDVYGDLDLIMTLP